MIIIDYEATAKLTQALKSLPDPEGSYSIRLHPIDGNADYIRPLIISQAKAYLTNANIYFCEDGDMFVLAHNSTAKECKKTMLAIATAFRIQPVELVGELYDLGLHYSALLLLLEKKLDAKRQAEESAAHQQSREQAAALAARKRKEILSQGVRKNAEEIAAQRTLRSEPVLMIIEDDPFSRRLVENVLQKKYQLTGLDSAERALATYVDIAPDLLFLDINLPDVTGHELLEKIIALDPKAYVVMLSGNADKHNIMHAMQHGAVGFVAKPFSRDKLFQYIERCPTIAKERV